MYWMLSFVWTTRTGTTGLSVVTSIKKKRIQNGEKKYIKYSLNVCILEDLIWDSLYSPVLLLPSNPVLGTGARSATSFSFCMTYCAGARCCFLCGPKSTVAKIRNANSYNMSYTCLIWRNLYSCSAIILCKWPAVYTVTCRSLASQ